jgi:hypothetical protein
MKDTEISVGEDTSVEIRTGVVYSATHPQMDGIYIGATYSDLKTYKTSSPEILSIVESSGVKPTLTVLDSFNVDWSVEKILGRQIIFKREQEIYDLMAEMGVRLVNKVRPIGYCNFVDGSMNKPRGPKSAEFKAMASEVRAKTNSEWNSRIYRHKIDGRVKSRASWYQVDDYHEIKHLLEPTDESVPPKLRKQPKVKKQTETKPKKELNEMVQPRTDIRLKVPNDLMEFLTSDFAVDENGFERNNTQIVLTAVRELKRIKEQLAQLAF